MQPYPPQQPPYGNAFPPAQPGFPPGAPPAAPPKKKTNWALIGGVGCLSVLVVCCVLPVGGFFGGNAIAKGDAEDTIEELAEIGRARDGARMYELLDSYARSNAQPAQMTDEINRCPGLSTNTAARVTDVRIDFPLDDFILVDVEWTTPTGPVNASVGLGREDGRFKVGTYHELGNLPFGQCDLRPERTYDYGY